MRVAIIADTHGNLISLNAVLDEIAQDGADRIVCLGDVAGLGPQPLEVIDRLRALGCPVVMGNADEFLLDPSILDPERHPDADEDLRRLHDTERWCARQLRPEDLEFIRTFQPTVEIPLEGDRTLLCYHGSPRSNVERIQGSTSDEDLAERLGARQTALMAGGHTHEQLLRRLNDTIVINPGSVGLPYEIFPDGGGRNPPWAEYAVVTSEDGRLGVDLRRVPVDAASIREALLNSGMPHAEEWAADWR